MVKNKFLLVIIGILIAFSGQITNLKNFIFDKSSYSHKVNTEEVSGGLHSNSFFKTNSTSGSDNVAEELKSQGWSYTMPIPKSDQAEWGNEDGRTTWYYGYWYNQRTHEYSEKVPIRNSSGKFEGDKQNLKGKWRRGGSPPPPTKVMKLLSTEE